MPEASDTPNPAGGVPPPPVPPNSQPRIADVDRDTDRSVGQRLGEQVHPDTQTSEKDGHRTLVRPRTDPGPTKQNDGQPDFTHPDRTKGEHRYADSNDALPVTMRTSTGHSQGFGRHDGDVLGTQHLPPEVYANHAASEDYYPEGGGKTLTEEAQRLALEPKVQAVTRE